MYVCMYACAYICIYVCIRHVCMYVCVCVCVYVCACLHAECVLTRTKRSHKSLIHQSLIHEPLIHESYTSYTRVIHGSYTSHTRVIHEPYTGQAHTSEWLFVSRHRGVLKPSRSGQIPLRARQQVAPVVKRQEWAVASG